MDEKKLLRDITNARDALANGKPKSADMILYAIEYELTASEEKPECAWDDTASPDFDGCNGCKFSCGSGNMPGAEKENQCTP
jgi:hypothetical protein